MDKSLVDGAPSTRDFYFMISLIPISLECWRLLLFSKIELKIDHEKNVR